MHYLLDTSTLSLAVALRPDASILRRLDTAGPECAIAAAVWHELLFGVERLEPGRRRTFLTSYLTNLVLNVYPILPYDEPAAAWHAKERARLGRLGTPAPLLDSQIAAVAAVHGLTVVTANVGDFQLFDGLSIEDWATSP